MLSPITFTVRVPPNLPPFVLTPAQDLVGSQSRRTETTYVAAGRAVKSRDALGHETVTVHDAAGRTMRTVFADSNTVTTIYDQRGRRVAATDQLGQVTNYEYDKY